MTTTTAQLHVNVTYNPIAFIYKQFTPTITINHTVHRRPWGAHVFEVVPGSYDVSVSYPWLLSPECGKSTVHFEIRSGESRVVTYRAGLVRFLPGSISVK